MSTATDLFGDRDIAELMADVTSDQDMFQGGVTKEGVNLWWNIGPATDPEPLRKLTEDWFPGSKLFAPNLRSWNDCLTRSLREIYPAGKYDLKTTKVDKTLLASIEVRKIIKGLKHNDLPRVGTAELVGDEDSYYATFHMDGDTLSTATPDITKKVSRLRASLPAEAVGEWLAQMVMSEKLNGVRPNLGGKIYFLPIDSMSLLKRLQVVVKLAADRQVCQGARNRITAVRVMDFSAELLEDLSEGLEQKISHQLAKIEAVAQSGVGIRSLQARQRETESLLRQLQGYRDMLVKKDVVDIQAKITTVQRLLGVEVARAQGEQIADSGQEELLDSMLM